jgi:hypothetical protein
LPNGAVGVKQNIASLTGLLIRTLAMALFFTIKSFLSWRPNLIGIANNMVKKA